MKFKILFLCVLALASFTKVDAQNGLHNTLMVTSCENKKLTTHLITKVKAATILSIGQTAIKISEL